MSSSTWNKLDYRVLYNKILSDLNNHSIKCVIIIIYKILPFYVDTSEFIFSISESLRYITKIAQICISVIWDRDSRLHYKWPHHHHHRNTNCEEYLCCGRGRYIVDGGTVGHQCSRQFTKLFIILLSQHLKGNF